MPIIEARVYVRTFLRMTVPKTGPQIMDILKEKGYTFLQAQEGVVSYNFFFMHISGNVRSDSVTYYISERPMHERDRLTLQMQVAWGSYLPSQRYMW